MESMRKVRSSDIVAGGSGWFVVLFSLSSELSAPPPERMSSGLCCWSVSK